MDINRMIAVVQLYIGIRKNKNVNININGVKDIILLTQAYNVSTNWMNNNNVSIKHL